MAKAGRTRIIASTVSNSLWSPSARPWHHAAREVYNLRPQWAVMRHANPPTDSASSGRAAATVLPEAAEPAAAVPEQIRGKHPFEAAITNQSAI